MEKELKIKNVKYQVYGILNTIETKNKKDKIIIFIHGLTGSSNEHQFYNGARYFLTRSFASVSDNPSKLELNSFNKSFASDFA